MNGRTCAAKIAAAGVAFLGALWAARGAEEAEFIGYTGRWKPGLGREEFVGGGQWRPEWEMEGIPGPPESEKWAKHFLRTNQTEVCTAEWGEKLERREKELAGCDWKGEGSQRWRALFLDAAAWRYPRNGQLDVAGRYFRQKSAWAQRALENPEWMHDVEMLEAAAEILSEIGEWSIPQGIFWFEAKPGQGVLRAAGVERPEDLPDEASKAAWRKAVEEDARRWALDGLRDVLSSESRWLSECVWRHCKQAMVAAEKEKDDEKLSRLKAIKARIMASVEADYRLFLLHDGFADMPDIWPPPGAEGGL